MRTVLSKVPGQETTNGEEDEEDEDVEQEEGELTVAIVEEEEEEEEEEMDVEMDVEHKCTLCKKLYTSKEKMWIHQTHSHFST